MSWSDIDLSNVSADMERIPEGKYVLDLLSGAKYSQFNPNKIEAGAKIAEGDYTGRVVYFSYGDPDKVPAMVGALKRLEMALSKNSGIEIASHQDPVDYLNTQAGAKFLGEIKHRTFENKDGETDTRVELAVFKVKPIPAEV